MSTTYADYTRDRIGWFFGISGGQLIFLAIASLPPRAHVPELIIKPTVQEYI